MVVHTPHEFLTLAGLAIPATFALGVRVAGGQ